MTKRQVYTVGPKPATRGGVNGSRSKFLLKFRPSAYIPKPLQTLEPEPARIAMNKLSQSKRPESQSGSKTRTLLKLWLCWDRPVWPLARTGQTGRAGIWKSRPVRPVAPRQPANKASNRKTWANEVQISSNLEESVVTTPWTYPQNISPEGSTDREKSRENQRGLGFSQEHEIDNPWELMIPRSVALG